MRPRFSMTEVDDGVFFIEGPASNWTVLTDGKSATLIDAGYPRDVQLVEQSLHEAAGAAPLTDIIVTHGHSDHIGSIPTLVARHEARVWASSAEIPNVTREELHQIGVSALLPLLWKPRYLRWAVHAIRAGGLAPLTVKDVIALLPDRRHIFSGHPVVAQVTPGHTPGHLVLELPDSRVLVTGDLLITAHPTSLIAGPQMLEPMWHWDAEKTRREASVLPTADRTLLPGHGPLLSAQP